MHCFLSLCCCLSISVASLFAFQNEANAEDWAQWRGKHRDGQWNESGTLETFTDKNLKTLWRQPIGAGYSGPTVADGRAYVTGRSENPKQVETINCFDAKTGKPIWDITYPAIYTVGYTAGPRASVTIDETRAYALGAMGMLHCVKADDGEVIWKKDLDAQYNISKSKRMPIWGIACSPIIYGDTVVIVVGGGQGAALVAFNKKTGDEVWRSLDDPIQYSSPILTKQNGKDVLVCWTGAAVVGLNPATGETYWSHPFKPSRMPIGIATPLIKDRKIFLTSFYDGSLMLEMSNEDMTVKGLWSAKGPNERKTKALHSIISTPIWIEDHIYGVDSYGQLRCLKADDGQRVWESQKAVAKERWGTVHFVSHGEDVWMFNEQGEVIVGRLSPEGLTELSRVKIIEPTRPQLPKRKAGVCWSHPAFANRCIYARNDNEILCIDLSKDAE